MKNKIRTTLFISSLLLTGIFSLAIALVLNATMDDVAKYTTVAMISLILLATFVIMIVSAISIKRKRETIKEAFDSYVEESVSTAGVGLVIFNDNSDIIWISKFIEERVGSSIIGKKLYALSESFNDKFKKGMTSFRFELSGIIFQSMIDFETKTIVLKDVSNEDMVMKQYESEKIVVGELEIDNFQQLQTSLPEEELFKVRSAIIKMLDELVEKYNLIYRQYVNGKYLIYTNKFVLDELVKKKFNFLDKLKNKDALSGMRLSASLGIGSGSSQMKELIELGKDGLTQALARGGDQVAVMELNKKPVYFGSKTEASATSSRVKIKQISKLFEEKLEMNSIKKVIVYGHIHADLDAVGSALGIAHLAKEYGKEVFIQNATFDYTTNKALNDDFTKEEREIFIKKTKANKITDKKSTLVVIVDTADLSRIENDKAIDNVIPENIFMFDHHRVSKLPENISTANTYIDTSASSASEIVSEVLQFISRSIKPERKIAQMLLNGIYLDTKQFTKSTSSRTFAAASWLEKFGATSQNASEILKLPAENATLVATILSSVKEIKKGYFLASYKGEVPQDIISLAADEILRVQGRKAAFVIAKMQGTQEFKLSARGFETNVQIIAEEVGGGGHFGAAAATSKESLTIFEDNIIQAIVTKREGDYSESNNN